MRVTFSASHSIQPASPALRFDLSCFLVRLWKTRSSELGGYRHCQVLLVYLSFRLLHMAELASKMDFLDLSSRFLR